MKKYKVSMEFTFSGDFIFEAESDIEAKDLARQFCWLYEPTVGCDLDEVEWDVEDHPSNIKVTIVHQI